MATFSVLRKLDHCFASLLAGEDLETHETLPGFENGPRIGGMSRTDMVRCKSIVERSRIIIVDVMAKEPEEEEVRPEEHGDGTELDNDAETASGRGAIWDDDDDDDFHMDVARVYEKTLVKLGETLGEGASVGDLQITDD
jgi:hypothetical protein